MWSMPIVDSPLNVISLLKRWQLELKDRLRFSPLLRRLACQKELWLNRLPQADDPQALARSIVRLCTAARRAPSPALQLKIEERIQSRLRLLDPARVDWTEFDPRIGEPGVGKAAVLKPWLSPREKGVVFFSFEEQWLKILRHADVKAFADRYDAVVAPTWSPPHHIVNFLFPKAFPGPVFCLISNWQDLEIFPRFAANYVMVPLFASSWVHPVFYQPVPAGQKDIDLIMVANFGTYKRHHALFKALARMPDRLRVLLVGQEQDGRTMQTLRDEARSYGVENRFDIRCNVSNEELAHSMARARVSTVLSRREGSCVVVVESMFAGTPVGLLDTAVIGSKHFINEQTGRLLRERYLAEDLTDFIARADSYHPRQWAEQNITCSHSTAVLNGVLRKHSLDHGQEWTQDIALMCWRPDPQVVNPDDCRRLEPSRQELRERFGLMLSKPKSLTT
jgi:glycosyltransferase involved in cell wall biosynthesis